MKKNQIFLVSCRDEVVLFCTKVLQKYATIHHFGDFNCISDDADGIIIFDACHDEQALSFLQKARDFSCSVICFLSPLLSVRIQGILSDFASKCFYSITNQVSKNRFSDFANSFFTDFEFSGNFRSRTLVTICNEPINGFFSGVSAGIQKFRIGLRKVCELDTPVLLLGETGCGKTTAARLIHSLSERKRGPFVAVNVAEVVPSLAESAFFGKILGAYTDATPDSGFFQRANHGTIFLDEIGTSQKSFQEKILTFIEDKKITPVGSTKSVTVDTRIILATNANIRLMLKKGTFRQDLFYRIDNHILEIPPLRDRPEDIPYIVKQYLKDKKVEKFLSPSAMEKLMNFTWLGNIRELQHCLDRTILNCPNERIMPEDLDFGIFNNPI